MARFTKTVTVTRPGRDHGKRFLLTEWPADQGEKFAARSLLALSRGGFELPDGIFANGWAGLASIMPYLLVVGLRALHGAQWAEIEPLLDEMMTCVVFIPPGAGGDDRLNQPIYPGVNSQIEEATTRWDLRREVVQLHVGFLVVDDPSTSGQPPPAQASSTS